MIDLVTIKLWSKRILYAIVLIFAFLFVLTKCGGCDNKIEVVKTDNTSLFAKIKSDSLLILDLKKQRLKDSLKTVASKHAEDSIKAIADKNEKLYRSSAKRVRELIALGICDTVATKIALDDCDSTIKSKNSLIARKDSTNESINKELTTVKKEVTVLTDDNATLKIVVKNLSGDYKALEKTSKKALRKQKFKTIVAIIGGVIVEVLTIFTLK